MFPVFSSLLMIVSRFACSIVKQPRNIRLEFAKPKCRVAGFARCLCGIRHSVYPLLKEKHFFVSFFFIAIFERAMLYRTNCRLEFRLLQPLVQIDPEGFTANSRYRLLELIRYFPMGINFLPAGTDPRTENIFFKSVFHLMVCVISFAFTQRPMANALADRVKQVTRYNKMA